MPQPPTPVRRYHQSLLETVQDIGRHQKWFTSPLNLGGVPGPGGGSGIPIGGLIGQLIQSKVAYDTTEAEVLTPAPSGRSLVGNLDTIRWRIGWLETHFGSPLIVQEEGVQRASGVVIVNFQGGVNVTSPQPNTVNVIVTATGGGSVLGGVTVVFEDLTSQIPATNDFYVVSQTIMSGTSQVYMNGLHQVPSYYTETTSGVGLSETLVGTDELLIEYLTSGGTTVGLKVFDTGVFQASGVTELNFIGATDITVSGTRVNVTFSGGGGGAAHTLGSATHTDVTITSVGDDDILAYDTGGDWINQTAAEANLATAGHTHTDVVDVSADDTTAGYLEDKIVAGSNIVVAVLNEAGDEDLQITASGLSMSGHLHIEADITDLSHDAVKIRGRDVSTDAPVVGEAYRWDGAEWIPSGVAGGAGDTKKVLVSSNDTTESYLEDKIVAGTNVTVTTLNEGANETVEITSTASGGGGSAIEVRDEGVPLTSGVTSLDFVGGGVTAIAVGDAVTVTIPSGLGGGGGGGEIDFGDWEDGALEWFANESQATLDASSFTKYSHVGRTVHVIAYLQSDSGSLTGTFTLRNLPIPADSSIQVGVAPLGLVRHRDEGTAFRDLYPIIDGTTPTRINLKSINDYNTYSDTIDVDDAMVANLTYYAASGATVPGGGGSAINVDDEGVNIASGITNLNFVGGGVTATASGTSVTVTVPSGAGGGGEGVDTIFPAISIFDNTSDTYTDNDSLWEQMGSASGIITTTVEDAPLLALASFHVEPYDTSWEHYSFRFVLDGSTYSDEFDRNYDASRPHDVYGKLWTVQHVYTGAISAGDHSIALQWQNYSDLNMRSDWRNLSVVSLGAPGGGSSELVATSGTFLVEEVISELTLTAASGIFSVENIPQTYDSLRLEIFARTDRPSNTLDAMAITFNGDTGSNYSFQRSEFESSTGYSEQETGNYIQSNYIFTTNDAPSNSFGSARYHIPNYTNAEHKVANSIDAGGRPNSGNKRTGVSFGVWKNTAAITQVDVVPANGPNFQPGSTFRLIGIRQQSLVTSVEGGGGGGGGGLVLIEDIELTGDGTFDFTNIPQTFAYLTLYTSSRSDNASNSDQMKVTFNNDTGTNYSPVISATAADGGTWENGAGSESYYRMVNTADNGPSSFFSPNTLHILDYTNTARFKSAHGEGHYSSGDVAAGLWNILHAGTWNDTSAISGIQIVPVNGTNFKSGSRATLYGLGV